MSEKAFFQQFFSSGYYFFADTSRKKDFQPVKSPYFCVGQRKKKKKGTACKEPAKRIAIL